MSVCAWGLDVGSSVASGGLAHGRFIIAAGRANSRVGRCCRVRCPGQAPAAGQPIYQDPSAPQLQLCTRHAVAARPGTAASTAAAHAAATGAVRCRARPQLAYLGSPSRWWCTPTSHRQQGLPLPGAQQVQVPSRVRPHQDRLWSTETNDGCAGAAPSAAGGAAGPCARSDSGLQMLRRQVSRTSTQTPTCRHLSRSRHATPLRRRRRLQRSWHRCWCRASSNSNCATGCTHHQAQAAPLAMGAWQASWCCPMNPAPVAVAAAAAAAPAVAPQPAPAAPPAAPAAPRKARVLLTQEQV